MHRSRLGEAIGALGAFYGETGGVLELKDAKTHVFYCLSGDF